MRRIALVLGIVGALSLLGAAAPAGAQAAWGEPNGCGSGGWINDVLGANPYNATFTPACNLHDWCYGGALAPVPAGAIGDWASRRTCDDLFRRRMLAACGSSIACQLAAEDYYAAVRTFGDSILFGRPYTSGQRAGQHNLLPDPRRTRCTGCTAGVAAPTVRVNVRGSNTTYWKLNDGGWRRIACPAWDPEHVACTADVTLQLVARGVQVFRVKAVDYYTGAIGRTWTIASWVY